MGRRPRFCPPLLSNRCAEKDAPRSCPPRAGGEQSGASESSLARLSNVAVRHREELQLVREVELVSEVDLVPEVAVQDVRPSTSPSSHRHRSTTSIVRSPRLMFRSPLSRMVLSPTLQPRMRSPSSSLVQIDLNVPASSDFDLNADLEEQVDSSQDVDEIGVAQESARPRRKEVPNSIRKAVFDALLARARNGCLKGHETREVSEAFSVKIRTVQRIWDQGKKCLDRGIPIDVSNQTYKRGRKKMNVDVSILKNVPISKRTTIKDLAVHLGVSQSKAHSMKKDGTIKRVSNTVKPYLTDENKIERLKWCLSMVDPRTIPADPLFRGMFDYIFIDEKWFNITRKTARYYTAPGEEQPERTCKSTPYIPRLMFLAAVARPRFDSQANCTFDGKIGCFPFVTLEAAKRSSINRPAGTMEMKPMDSIKKDDIREFMIQKVLPAIRAKWPREDVNKPIYIQQDNARPHLSPDDALFCEAARENGFDIRLVCQPLNSPDLNILDLGFFNSIQSIQYKTTSRKIEDLVAVVEKAFQDYEVGKTNRIFLTLQACMKEVMKIGGGNRYNTPHIRKGMLERQGNLPLQLRCEASLVAEARAQINV